MIQAMSPIRKDFIAANLRVQINRLMKLLNSVEEHYDFEQDYTNESLKDIENNLRQIRKLCAN